LVALDKSANGISYRIDGIDYAAVVNDLFRGRVYYGSRRLIDRESRGIERVDLVIAVSDDLSRPDVIAARIHGCDRRIISAVRRVFEGNAYFVVADQIVPDRRSAVVS